MKKIIFTVILLSFLILLTGCSEKGTLNPDKQKYIACALGFDSDGEMLQMHIECIIINSEDLSDKYRVEILSGEGADLKEAFGKINTKITQPILYSHIAVITVGNSVTSKQFRDILEFCKYKNEINLASLIVSSENALELLKCEKQSSIAVGYDLLSLTDVVSKNNGITLRNKLYQIEAAQEKPMNTFFVPYIEVNDKIFSFSGLTVFRDDRPVQFLDDKDMKFFSFINNSCESGEYVLDGETVLIESIKTKYQLSYDKKLVINMNVSIKGSCNTKKLKIGMENLFKKQQHGTGDIFSFYNLLYRKEPEIWKKIKNNYETTFEKADFQVTVDENKGVF